MMQPTPWVVREKYGYIWVQRQGWNETLPATAFADPRVCYKSDTLEDANDLADLLNDRDCLLATGEQMLATLRTLRDARPDAWNRLVDARLCDAWDDLKDALRVARKEHNDADR
jgi:hypothetical protein